MQSSGQIAKRWFAEVWCQPWNEEAIDELMHEEVRLHDLGTPEPLGREEFKAFRRRFLTIVPDIHVEVSQVIADGDWAAIFAEVTGTHAESGQALRFNGGAMARIEDGRIIESRGAWDFLTMMVQAGVVSEELVASQF